MFSCRRRQSTTRSLRNSRSTRLSLGSTIKLNRFVSLLNFSWKINCCGSVGGMLSISFCLPQVFFFSLRFTHRHRLHTRVVYRVCSWLQHRTHKPPAKTQRASEPKIRIDRSNLWRQMDTILCIYKTYETFLRLRLRFYLFGFSFFSFAIFRFVSRDTVAAFG